MSESNLSREGNPELYAAIAKVYGSKPEPFTIGDIKEAILLLRVQWGEKDRVAEVLDKAIVELDRISKERADYYGSFGQ